MPNEPAQDAASVTPHHQAAANLYALIESTEDLIWSVDLNYGILTFNSALQRHLERYFGTQIAIGKRPEDLLPPERAAIWLTLFQRAIAQGPFRAELPIANDRTLEMSFNPIVIYGKVAGLSIFAKDVTERNRAERQLRETADFLGETQRIGAVGSYVLDIPSGTWTSSDVLDELFGIGKDHEHTVASWTALIHLDDRAMMAEYFANEVVGKKQKFEKEYRIVRARDKAVRWFHGMGSLEFDAAGQPEKMRGVIKDVTERKLAELKIRDSEETYRATFEQAGIGIMHVALDGRIQDSNARFAEIIGYPLDEVCNLTIQQISPPEDLDESFAIRAQLLDGAIHSADWEKRYIRKDGSLTWVKPTVALRRDQQGRALNFISMVEDINALKASEEHLEKAQEALRLSEERYRAAFQTSLDAININRLSDGAYIDCNQAFLDMIGFSRDELIGHTTLELNMWTDRRAREEMIDTVQRHGGLRNLELRIRKKNGDLMWGLMSVSTIEIEGVLCLLSVTRDISEAKAAQQRLAAADAALRVSEQRYRTVFQTSLDAITINRADNDEYIDVNRTFLDVMEYTREEVIGRTPRQLNQWNDLGDRKTLIEALSRSAECRNLETQFRRKSGELVSGLVSAAIIEIDGVRCVLAITRDITERKAAEEEIRNLAFYDPLTGSAQPPPAAGAALRQSLAASQRSGRMRALLFIDLDNFKTLNDTLGHQTGDLLLQEAARRLTACVREGDTVAPPRRRRVRGDAGRPERTSRGGRRAGQAGRRENPRCRGPALPARRPRMPLRAPASASPSSVTSREGTNEILQQADIAMYQAKAAGRNAMRFFDPPLQAAVNARAAWKTICARPSRSRPVRALLPAPDRSQGRTGRRRGPDALAAPRARHACRPASSFPWPRKPG